MPNRSFLLLLVVGVALAALTAGLARWPLAAPLQASDAVIGVSAEGLTAIDVAVPDVPRQAGFLGDAKPGLDVAAHPVEAIAYVAADGVLAIVDVSNPSLPELAGSVPAGTLRVVGVKVADGRLFEVLQDPRSQTESIAIYDLPSPTKPALVGTVDLAGMVLGLDAAGGYLYVATGEILVAYDVGSPDTPKASGRIARPAVDVAVDGRVAYVLQSDGLAVADLTTPGQPEEVGFTQLPVSNAVVVDSLQDAKCSSGCGRAVIGAELDATGGGGGIIVVDAQVPARPRPLDPVADGLAVHDLESVGAWIHVAAAAGYFDFSFDPAGLPVRIGNLQISIDALAHVLIPGQATATPTATLTRVTPSVTATETPVTATPTSTETLAATATEIPTRATPTRATATPTRGPSATPGTRPVWERFDADGPAAFDRVRYVRQGPQGRVWMRVRRANGGPDQVVESYGDRISIHASLHAAVQSRYPQILADGTVPDFWSVDPMDRVWIGPEYYDGAAWHRLAVDEHQPGGGLTHEERALLDAQGRAWVPFHGVVSCTDPAGCATAGMRVFGEDALEEEVPLDLVPEAGSYGVETVHLVPGPRTPLSLHRVGPGGDAVARDADAARVVRDGAADSVQPAGPASSAAPLADEDVDWVVAQTALLVLPGGESVAYPQLEDAGGPTQNAGYATAATRRPDGLLQVFTWVEDHTARPDLTWRALANTWDGAAWAVWDLTEACPLVHDGNEEFIRITAAAYGPDGTLWLGSSDGELATWRDGAWLDHFTSGNSPLLAGRPVTDIYVTDTGSTWVVQPGALLTYGPAGTLEPVVGIYLPSDSQNG